MLRTLIALFFCPIWLQGQNRFTVAIALTEPPNARELKVAVRGKYLPGDKIEISKSRSQDYRKTGVRAMANYVIELQRWGGEGYQPLEPTADIDPVFEKEEYEVIPKKRSDR